MGCPRTRSMTRRETDLALPRVNSNQSDGRLQGNRLVKRVKRRIKDRVELEWILKGCQLHDRQ